MPVTFTYTEPVPGIGLTVCSISAGTSGSPEKGPGFYHREDPRALNTVQQGPPRYQSQGHCLQPLDSLAPFWAALHQIAARAGSAGETRTLPDPPCTLDPLGVT